MNKPTFIVEKTNTGYSAYCDLGETGIAATTGAYIAELRANALEAYNALMSETNGKSINENDLILEYDLKQFFEFYNIVNGSKLASRIGMSRSLLSQYVNGQKKPSKEQVNKILNGVRLLGSELLTVELI